MFHSSIRSSNKVKISIAFFFVLVFLHAHTSLAVPINLSDKTILYDWITKWNNASLLLQVNWATNECTEILRRGSGSALTCSTAGRVLAINMVGDTVDNSPANTVAGVEIPPQLANMTMLNSLTLHNLLLIGTIPNELFSSRSNWEYFRIKGNRIWGTIPPSITQQLGLIEFVVEENLLDGVVPDFGGLPQLAAFSIRNNNFACPQPNLRPSNMTRSRFPALSPGSCALQYNMMSRPEDEPGTFCGEPAVHPDSICSVLPQNWLSKTFSSTPKFRVRPTGSRLSLEVDKYRHALRILLPNGTKIDTPAFNVDILYFFQYNINNRLLPIFHKVSFLDGYDEMFNEGDTGRKFRFRKRFNGTRNIVDTVWEFIGTSSFKFSLDLQNWDFPEGTDRLSFDTQLSWVAPLFDYQSIPSCFQQPWENRIGTTFSDNTLHVSCAGSVAEISVVSNIKFPDVSLVPNFTSTNFNAFMDIPLGYSRDLEGTDYLFPHGGDILVVPIGRLEGMNYANRSGFRAELLERLAREDPLGQQQLMVIRTALEMKKFTNAYYDPTVTLSSVFIDQVENALETQPTATNETSSVNLGIYIGVPLAIVVVIGVIVAFVLSRGVRRKVAPFLVREMRRPDTLAMEDDKEKEKPDDAPQPTAPAARAWRFSVAPSTASSELSPL